MRPRRPDEIDEQVNRAFFWLRRRRNLAALALVVATTAVVISATWADRVTAWKSTVVEAGARGFAIVEAISDDQSSKNQNDRIFLRISEPDQFSMSIDNVSDIARYRVGERIDVWYDPARRGRIATELDVSSEGIEDWADAAVAASCGLALWATLVLGSVLLGLWTARRGDFREVHLDGIGRKSAGKGERTLLQFDEADEPWSVRWHTPKSVPLRPIIAGRGMRRIVMTDRPFTVRRAMTAWARQNWRTHLVGWAESDDQ